MNLKATDTMRGTTGASGTAAVLLHHLIDYAGLFPPAALDMTSAVANYETHLRSEYSWILGRFILPAARLEEFQKVLEGHRGSHTATRDADSTWELSVLLGPDVSADNVRIREFKSGSYGFPIQAEIKSVEVKIATPEEIERLSAIIPAGLETYFEVPLLGSHRECIAAISNCGRRAKMRTGGETADKFPAPESVVAFIRLCAGSNVPFKATAGLHHPLRSLHRLTYQPESPSGVMHGFLNVFLASAFIRAGMDSALAVLLLQEQSPQAFHFDSDGILWREHRVTLRDIAAARQEFSMSFGSCSFTEPIDDLRSLHLL